MILLDTNHVSILRMPPSERRTRLVERMTLAHHELFGIPIVAVFESSAISLVSSALLLTANRRDFEKVPGLRFENWPE